MSFETLQTKLQMISYSKYDNNTYSLEKVLLDPEIPNFRKPILKYKYRITITNNENGIKTIKEFKVLKQVNEFIKVIEEKYHIKFYKRVY